MTNTPANGNDHAEEIAAQYSLDNVDKYGSGPSERIGFLKARLQANKLVVYALKKCIDDVSKDPLVARFPSIAAEPTVASQSKRIEALDRSRQTLFTACISATENSMETMVMLHDQLRLAKANAASGAGVNRSGAPRTASRNETVHTEISNRVPCEDA
jgi:hypothetical protein